MSTDLLLAIENFTDTVAFERLCCDVLARIGYIGLDPQGVGRKDGGKDALLHHPSLGYIVFHFSLRKDWARKLVEDVESVKASGRRCDLVVFFTNRKVTAAEKDRSKRTVKETLGSNLEIFDQERLRIVLGSDEALCLEYFPNYIISGKLLPELVRMLGSLVQEGLVVPNPQQLDSLPDVLDKASTEAMRYAAYGDEANALQCVQKIVSLSSSFKKAASICVATVGCAFFGQGKRRLAEDAWRKALLIDSSNFLAQFNLGVAAEFDDRGRRYAPHFQCEIALCAYERALELADAPLSAAECLDNWGAVLVKLGEVEQAKEKFRAALQRCSSYARAQLHLACLLEDEEARYETFLSLKNSDVRDLACMNLGFFYIKRDDYKSAYDIVKDLDLNSELASTSEVMQLLCKVHLGLGNYVEAQKYAEKNVEMYYEDAYAHVLLSVVASRRGDVNGQIAALEGAISFAPENAEYHVYLAEALRTVPNSCSRAIEHLRAAIRLQPLNEKAYLLLGMAYIEENMFASAGVALRRSVEINPSDPRPYFHLGFLAEHDVNGGRYASAECIRSAISLYERALEYRADYWEVLVNIGTCFLLIGESQAALEHLEKALQMSPNNEIVLTNLAGSYLKVGRYDDAIACCEKVIAVNPHNDYINAKLRKIRKIMARL